MEWWKIFIIVLSCLGAAAYPIYYLISELIEKVKENKSDKYEEDFGDDFDEDEDFIEWDQYLDIEEKAWFFSETKDVEINKNMTEYVDVEYINSNLYGVQDHFQDYENLEEVVDMFDDIQDFYLDPLSDNIDDIHDIIVENCVRAKTEKQAYRYVELYLEFLHEVYSLVKERVYVNVMGQLVTDIDRGRTVADETYMNDRKLIDLQRRFKKCKADLFTKLNQRGKSAEEKIYDEKWQSDMYDFINNLLDKGIYDDYIEGQVGGEQLGIEDSSNK